MHSLTVPDEVIRKDEEFKFMRIEKQLKQLPWTSWRIDAIPACTLVGIKLNNKQIVFIEFGVDIRLEEVVESPLEALGWFPIE
jgi:hypothetical protein